MKQMSQLGKMFTYIALRQLQSTCSSKYKPVTVDQIGSGVPLVVKLTELGMVHTNMQAQVLITKRGGELVAKYFAAVADELRANHFGKFTWSKRSKFHKALMQRIA